jgi:hypothetical protein
MFITIDRFRHYGLPIDLVYSILDSAAELTIQEMIEAAQRMIKINNSQGEEPEIPINPATKRDCELTFLCLPWHCGQYCPTITIIVSNENIRLLPVFVALTAIYSSAYFSLLS